jgi:hypothetical protein
MTDADILSRAAAFDRDGLLVAWTPEAVGARLVEAYRVFDRTPMSFGPKGAQGFWPGLVMTWQDLVDEKDQQRLMAAYGEKNVDWQEWVDDRTIRQLSRDRGAEITKRAERLIPTAAAYSRAEEAMRWPAVYLADQPLLADAISTFSACRGLKLSLDHHMSERRRAADKLIGIARAFAKFKRLKTVEIVATRQTLFPGRNFNAALVYERRKAAAAAICAGLILSRVMVRSADEAVSDG